MHEPALLFEYTIDRLPIDHGSISESQARPQPWISKRRMLLDQLPQPLRPRRICHRTSRVARFRPMQAGSAAPKHLATPPLRDTRRRASHASDVFRSKGEGFNASRKISLSRTRSPIFWFSFLIGSSFTASSSYGRVRSAFSAPDRNFSRQSSTSATVSPCVRAASATEVSPFRRLTTRATGVWPSTAQSGLLILMPWPPPWSTSGPCLRGGLAFKGSRIV